MPDFPTIQHVAVTVKDLEVSRPWYERLFGAAPVLDEDTGPFHHVVWALGGGTTLFGIHAFPDPGPTDFNERNRGLDHVGFSCASKGELEEWAKKLDELGITHGGVVDATYGHGVSFRDPDNIALEFFAFPG